MDDVPSSTLPVALNQDEQFDEPKPSTSTSATPKRTRVSDSNHIPTPGGTESSEGEPLDDDFIPAGAHTNVTVPKPRTRSKKLKIKRFTSRSPSPVPAVTKTPSTSTKEKKKKGTKRQKKKEEEHVDLRPFPPEYPAGTQPLRLGVPTLHENVPFDTRARVADVVRQRKCIELSFIVPDEHDVKRVVHVYLDYRVIAVLANLDHLDVLVNTDDPTGCLVRIDAALHALANPRTNQGIDDFWYRRPHVPVHHTLPVIKIDLTFTFPFTSGHAPRPTEETWRIFVYAHSNVLYNDTFYAANCRHPLTRWDEHPYCTACCIRYNIRLCGHDQHLTRLPSPTSVCYICRKMGPVARQGREASYCKRYLARDGIPKKKPLPPEVRDQFFADVIDSANYRVIRPNPEWKKYGIGFMRPGNLVPLYWTEDEYLNTNLSENQVLLTAQAHLRAAVHQYQRRRPSAPQEPDSKWPELPHPREFSATIRARLLKEEAGISVPTEPSVFQSPRYVPESACTSADQNIEDDESSSDDQDMFDEISSMDCTDPHIDKIISSLDNATAGTSTNEPVRPTGPPSASLSKPPAEPAMSTLLRAPAPLGTGAIPKVPARTAENQLVPVPTPTGIKAEDTQTLANVPADQLQKLETRFGGNTDAVPSFGSLAAHITQQRASTDSLAPTPPPAQPAVVTKSETNLFSSPIGSITQTSASQYQFLSTGTDPNVVVLYDPGTGQVASVNAPGSTASSVPYQQPLAQAAACRPDSSSPQYQTVMVPNQYPNLPPAVATPQYPYSALPNWHSATSLVRRPVPCRPLRSQNFDYSYPIEYAGKLAQYPTQPRPETQRQFSLHTDPYGKVPRTFRPHTDLGARLHARLQDWYSSVPPVIDNRIAIDTSGFVPSSICTEPPAATPDQNSLYPTDADELTVTQSEIVRQDACVRAMLKLSELDELMHLALTKFSTAARQQEDIGKPTMASIGRLINVLRNSHTQREDLLLDMATIITAQRRRDNSYRTFGSPRTCDITCPLGDTIRHVIPFPTPVHVSQVTGSTQPGTAAQPQQYQRQ